MDDATAYVRLKEQARHLPERPGVYIFRDARGEALYVGKARNLRQRVRSYFQRSRQLTDKLLHMVHEARALEVIATDTEVEALILESTLIKRLQPRYNIKWRDDKHYPFLKVTVHQPWPRVLIARRPEDDGARYFGPYPDAGALYETLRAVRSVFPYRTCSDYRLRQRGRPCLEYYIGRCLGPCDDRCTAEEYARMIDELCAFLAGRADEVVGRLEREMHEAAERLEFERAARLRDRIRALRRVMERQKVYSPQLEDEDVVACARDGDLACVQVFTVREGRVVGRDHALVEGVADLDDGRLLAEFLKRHYAEAPYVPRAIDLAAPLPADEADAVAAWLAARRGSPVALRVPRRGERRALLELVARNARLVLEQERLRREAGDPGEAALADLAARLGLEGLPRRIEAYDISNIHGQHAVGAMVVFVDGRPARSHYRLFRIRTVEGPDDFAMLREVLFRRFRRGLAEAQGDGVPGARGFGQLPDLIVIDGGKGQLSAALEVLRALNLDHIPALGLAKRFEHVYLPGEADPLVLPPDAPALRLLQQLRDEAHRFGLSRHRRLRTRASLRSLLEEVPGIGPRRRRALLERFGSLQALRQASVEELAAVPGMTRPAAEALKAFLARHGAPGGEPAPPPVEGAASEPLAPQASPGAPPPAGA